MRDGLRNIKKYCLEDSLTELIGAEDAEVCCLKNEHSPLDVYRKRKVFLMMSAEFRYSLLE